jgi:hypothetical protein
LFASIASLIVLRLLITYESQFHEAFSLSSQNTSLALDLAGRDQMAVNRLEQALDYRANPVRRGRVLI